MSKPMSLATWFLKGQIGWVPKRFLSNATANTHTEYRSECHFTYAYDSLWAYVTTMELLQLLISSRASPRKQMFQLPRNLQKF